MFGGGKLSIPKLETQRLILRGFEARDFDGYAAMMADPDVARYIAPAPMSRGDAWRSLASSIGHWTLRGYGVWAVERKSDGALVGRVGMINPEGWPALEIGWTLAKEYWGKGYATEAAAASMAYAFFTQPVDRLVSNIDPENVGSQSVALRLGETKGARRSLSVGGKDYPVDEWSITRSEWQKRASSA
ncbi:MAG: GNAT family N-acetyltransferase [Proteobacteria bacterium]|nr:GNAT family N-acetyltransferase [Pseudomonadota bacterium]